MSKSNNYEKFELLGHGSYGNVYRICNKETLQVYVLKEISLKGATKDQKESAEKEVHILSSINSPFVVGYYDSFQENEILNIVMEFCKGGDLSLLINRHTPKDFLDEKIIWKYFIQICVGIHSLHQLHILHRDLKPANIFIHEDNIKIGDLGIAKVLGSTSGFASTIVGTPYYLSPELCKNEPYNTKSDIWALGCILYECLTLNHPFKANNQAALILKILRGTYPTVTSYGGKYSSNIMKLVQLLLNKNNRSRPDIIAILRDPVLIPYMEEFNIDLPDGIVSSVKSKINPNFKPKNLSKTKKTTQTPPVFPRKLQTPSQTTRSAPSKTRKTKGKMKTKLSINDETKSVENLPDISPILLQESKDEKKKKKKKTILDLQNVKPANHLIATADRKDLCTDDDFLFEYSSSESENSDIAHTDIWEGKRRETDFDPFNRNNVIWEITESNMSESKLESKHEKMGKKNKKNKEVDFESDFEESEEEINEDIEKLKIEIDVLHTRLLCSLGETKFKEIYRQLAQFDNIVGKYHINLFEELGISEENLILILTLISREEEYLDMKENFK